MISDELIYDSSFILTNDQKTAEALIKGGLTEFFPFKKHELKTHYFVNEPKKVKPLMQIYSDLKMGFTSRLSA